MSENRKAVKIVNMGNLVIEDQIVRIVNMAASGTFGSPAADMESFNPSYGFRSDPVVFQSPFAMFGSAASIEELNTAVKETHDNLPWTLFELMATFPETFRISLMVGHQGVYTAMLESNEQSVFAWWVRDQEIVYTAATTTVEPKQRAPLNPSELLYGFSIGLQHVMINAPAFSIQRNEDNENVSVSYVDGEMAISNPSSAKIAYQFPSIKAPTEH